MFSLVRSRLRVLRRVAALAFLGVFAAPGIALASCPAQPVSTPFSQWGDNNNYFLVPGGSFEGTADQVGWTLSNASLTQGNEPFYVNDSGDSQSLTISGGGSATSPFFCVDNTMGSLRFFAQQVEAGGGLHVLCARAELPTARARRCRSPVSSMARCPPGRRPQPITGDTSGLSDDQTLGGAGVQRARLGGELADRRRVRRSLPVGLSPARFDADRGSVGATVLDSSATRIVTESATEQLLQRSWDAA